MAAIVFRDDSLARGIETAGSALGQALGQVAQEKRATNRMAQSGTILQNLIKTLPANPSIQDIQGITSQALQQGVPPDLIKMYADMYAPMLKAQASTAAGNEFLSSIGLNPSRGLIPSPIGTQGQQQAEPTPIQAITSAQKARVPVEQELPFYQKQQPAISNEQLTALALSPDKRHADFAKLELQRRDLEQKKFNEERAFHTKLAEKASEDSNQIRESIRGKESALMLARQAIETGETGPVSWANIAQHLGVPELMNAAGTELNQAGKEFFFGNMQRVAAKAQNQWLEQRITQLAAQVGDPKINALMKQTMLESELETSKAYLDAYDRLKKQDEQQYGYVRKDIQDRAFAESEPIVKKILDRTSFKTRELYEEEKGARWLQKNLYKKVPKGTILTPTMAKAFAIENKNDFVKGIENAKKLGYRIPTRQEVAEWQ